MSNGVNITVRTPPQLPVAASAAIADLFVLWQNSELKNITFEDFMVSVISGQSNNSLAVGNDNKLFVGVQPPRLRRHLFQNPYSYCGTAPAGSAESDPVWSVTRIEVLANGSTVLTTATGAWTNVTNLNYI